MVSNESKAYPRNSAFDLEPVAMRLLFLHTSYKVTSFVLLLRQ